MYANCNSVSVCVLAASKRLSSRSRNNAVQDKEIFRVMGSGTHWKRWKMSENDKMEASSPIESHALQNRIKAG